MLGILVYKYLSELLLSVLLSIHLEMELLDHLVTLFLIFRGTAILFLSGCTILHSQQHCPRVRTSPHPRQHLSFLLFAFPPSLPSSSFPPFLPLFLSFHALWCSHPNRCTVVAHCGSKTMATFQAAMLSLSQKGTQDGQHASNPTFPFVGGNGDCTRLRPRLSQLLWINSELQQSAFWVMQTPKEQHRIWHFIWAKVFAQRPWNSSENYALLCIFKIWYL